MFGGEEIAQAAEISQTRGASKSCHFSGAVTHPAVWEVLA